MSFLSPGRLALLALPIVLLVAYLLVQRSRRRYTVRFTATELLASVAPRRPGWRRHLPAAGLLAALTVLVVGFARPAVAVDVPRERGTVVLALDVSASMGATDVAPTRLAAAQEAARRFIADLPDDIQLGVVTYAGTARLRVPPTTDRALVERSIDAIALGPGTATGEAILTALDTIAAMPTTDGETAGTAEAAPAVVVVMSDGTTTAGVPDAQAAAAAATAGVPVTTISYGTDGGTVTIDGQAVPVPVDRDALAAIATETGGQAYTAESAAELTQVYDTIGRAVGYDTEQREITATFTGVALAVAALASVGALVWTSRLP